jgi:hypothetical protein
MEENKMNFNEMTMKDLKAYARENGISCSKQIDGVKHNYTKAELIDVLNNHLQTKEVQEVVEETEDRVSIDENTSLNDLLAAKAEIERLISLKKSKHTKKDPRNEEYDENFSMYGGVNPFTFIHTRNKERYIEEATEGTLVAFLDENGKPRTAALINRSSKRRVIKVKTEFDWEFIVPYDKILWVKNGQKWAYGIYRILKGYNPNGNCGEDEYGEDFDEQ